MGVAGIIIAKAKQRAKIFQAIRDTDLGIQEQSAANAKYWQESLEKVQTALECMAEKGELKEANGRTFVELNLINEEIPTQTKGYLVTTERLVRERDGGTKSTFASTKSKRGHRETMISTSCELKEFIKLCDEVGVAVPQHLQERANAISAGAEHFIGSNSSGITR